MNKSQISAAAHDVWMRFVADELAGAPVDFERLCATHSEIHADLQALRTHWLMPKAPPGGVRAGRASESIETLLQRLTEPSTRRSRYRLEGEIARGGMGVVHRVWDGDLGRPLALKILRALPGETDRRALRRFVEEAKIVAALDHPAIVPVHDVGVDELGRPFFVMKLVEGDELREVFELAWQSKLGWSTTRVLGVLLKVAEAGGYAHERGVVHRDLKPSNVMVGRFGEVYVMDWGVARVLAELESDGRDEGPPTVARVPLPVRGERGDTDAALITADGEVIGTAAYMSPEQARGELDKLTPRSDVYAFGAMLYHLLARRAPYASEELTSAESVERLRAGPPPAIASVAPRSAPELVAICEKAMAHASEQRYANLTECADDLRAFLEGRVVRAHRTGAWTAAAKWIRRNRALSASFVAVMALAAGGLWTARRSAQVRENLELLSRLRQPTELLTEFELLWPPTQEALPALERWLNSAQQVAAHFDGYRAQLAELRQRAEPWDRSAAHERVALRDLVIRQERGQRLIEYLEAQRQSLVESGASKTFDDMTLADIDEQLERDRPKVAAYFAREIERETWTFSKATDQLLHDRLAALVPDLERLAVAADGFSPIERVQRAIEFLRRDGSARTESRSAAWNEACASIRDPEQCPLYGGLELAPQTGLVPIGRDAGSGLWEFAHLLSGEPAQRTADGRLLMKDATGIVLVLVPGAECHQGTQDSAPDEPYFDPWHEATEGPLTAVEIDPFYVSKYELTQAQWQRWTGCRPSYHTFPRSPDTWLSSTQPVEQVTWQECVDTLRELGLRLPTEAQWEYAARAGTQTPWSEPRGVAALKHCANLWDLSFERHAPFNSKPTEQSERLAIELGDDGFCGTAPVGSLAPNAWGLHDMHGNVLEWVADRGALDYAVPRWLGTGERPTHGEEQGSRVIRGGGFRSTARAARVGARQFLGAVSAYWDLGLRPVRAIEP
jgi:formylglycine-generating enzyme required for sulfatase activity